MEGRSGKMTCHLIYEGQRSPSPLKYSKIVVEFKKNSMSKGPEAGRSLAHLGTERKPRWQGRRDSRRSEHDQQLFSLSRAREGVICHLSSAVNGGCPAGPVAPVSSLP